LLESNARSQKKKRFGDKIGSHSILRSFRLLDDVFLSQTKRYMSSLGFPDINVWLAIAMREHVHTKFARVVAVENGTIAFSRFTQIGLLRQLTTAATMDGKPLTMERGLGSPRPVLH
jgi:hypothetical protein